MTVLLQRCTSLLRRGAFAQCLGAIFAAALSASAWPQDAAPRNSTWVNNISSEAAKALGSSDGLGRISRRDLHRQNAEHAGLRAGRRGRQRVVIG